MRSLELSTLVLAVVALSLTMTEALSVGDKQQQQQRKCQEITIPMCRGIPYNLTSYPNRFNHDTQEEAGLEVHQFWPLVEINCSPDLRFFLCSMYAPICMPSYHRSLPVCRSVCERVRAGCAPLMRQYGFSWPERMNCDDLPLHGDSRELCMEDTGAQGGGSSSSSGTGPAAAGAAPGGGASGSGSPSAAHRPSIKSLTPPPSTNNRPTPPSNRHDDNKLSDDDVEADGDSKCCSCKAPFVTVTNRSYASYYSAVTGGVRGCVQACAGPFAADVASRQFVQFWLALWSSLSLVSSLATVATFLISTNRFQYPERPIVYISVCYALISVAYVIRLTVGHDAVVCDHVDGASTASGSAFSVGVLRMETVGPPLCAATFGLLYFFGMASSLWWVVLAFSWFLSAGLKWGQEAITGYAHYFHVVAWLLPAIKTVVIVAASKIDGDPVAGVCYVGNTSAVHLRAFVIAPLCVYLLLGTIFLVAGFAGLFGVRRTIKTQQQHLQQRGGNSIATAASLTTMTSGGGGSHGPAAMATASCRGTTQKLDRLMVRIGIYSVLYTVPASVVIGCYLYEHHYRELWHRSINCPCPSTQSGSSGWSAGSDMVQSSMTGQCSCSAEQFRPDLAIFLVRYLMALVTGITSGFWVWSGKTLVSWRRFFARCCCCCQRRRRGAASDVTRCSRATTHVDVRYIAAHKAPPMRYASTEIPMSQSRI